MEHVNETDWIEYLAGTLQGDRKVWIDHHVKNCPACRAALEQTVALNEVLGQWQVDSSGHDIVVKVTQAVQSRTLLSFQSRVKHAGQHRFWTNVLRVAATVLIGVFLGHMAGKNSAKHLIAKQEGTSAQIKPNYLAGLDLQFASGLIWSVLEEDYTDSEHRE